MNHIYIGVVALFLLTSCNRIDRIPYKPKLTPAEWCTHQPCVEIGNIVISQPSSSVIVYFLALFSIAVAYYFIRTRNEQHARYWWGISLLLGGIGAALAGTSYQAFGYEIKCTGRENCVWTSWWEIGYEIFTVAGAGALLIAVGYSCFSIKWQKACWGYAIVNTLVYLIIVMTGALLPNKFLVSFELMILFTAPNYIAILILNSWQFYRKREPLVKQLICAWLLLFLTLGLYYFYLIKGITPSIWKSGIWFSENDVLHVGMIAWILYIFQILGKSIKDKEPAYIKTISNHLD